MRKSPEKPGRQIGARELAMDILTRVDQDKSYSNLLLNQMLQKHKLERVEAGLVTELVYGTIQRRNTIDYGLGQAVKRGLDKLEPWVRNLLRLSFYQLYYLERIPAHAAVHEAVEIAKRRGHSGISGMVNGVLRTLQRQNDLLALPDDLPPIQRIALEHSHPEWMVARWFYRYGEEAAQRICEANNERPHPSVRVNRLKHDRGEMLIRLFEAGYSAQASPLAPAGILLENGGNLAQTEWYRNGDISIQDESSMLVAEAVRPEPGMRVLDCCAAPGGKTTHMAELMDGKGEVIACDVHEHKEKLIAEQAGRLGLDIIRTVVSDARELAQRFEPASFDRILLDAPCSGLGVIRRKPDLKWAKEEKEIAEIAQVQHSLLEAVHGLLKPDGVLVYSTCTTEREENGGMIERFLREHEEFERIPFPEELLKGTPLEEGAREGMVQILPYHFGSDGFFIARLRKRKSDVLN